MCWDDPAIRAKYPPLAPFGGKAASTCWQRKTKRTAAGAAGAGVMPGAEPRATLTGKWSKAVRLRESDLVAAVVAALRATGHPLGLVALKVSLRERLVNCTATDLKRVVVDLERAGRVEFQTAGKGYVLAVGERAGS